MSTLGVAVAVTKKHLTLHKNKSSKSLVVGLETILFLTTPLVQADDILDVSPLDPDTLFPLLCSRIDMLHLSSKKLCTGLADCHIFQSLEIEVELLRNNLASDTGLTDTSLRSTWEDISWVKYSLSDALQTVVQALKNIPSPIYHQEVQHIISSALDLSSSQTLALVTKFNSL